MECSGKILLFIIIALLSPIVLATDLLNVYQLALKQDNKLKAAYHEFKENRAKSSQAFSALLPHVEFNGGVYKTNSRYQLGNMSNQFFAQPVPVSLTASGNLSGYELVLSQPLIHIDSLFLYQSTQKLAKLRLIKYLITKQELRKRVIHKYLNVLKAQAKEESILAKLKFLQRQLDSSNRRIKLNLDVQLTVDQIKTQLATTQVELLNAQNEKADAIQELTALSNRQFHSFAKIRPNIRVSIAPTSNMNGWIDAVKKHNLQLISSRIALAARHKQIISRKAEYLPSVDAVASYSNLDTMLPIFNEYNSRSATVGMRIKVPIYYGGYTNARVKEIHEKYLKEQYLADNLQVKLITSTKKIFNQLKLLTHKLAADKLAIATADRALTTELNAYQQGSKDILDIFNSIQMKTSAQTEYATDLCNYIILSITLQELAGALDDQALVKVNSLLNN